MIYGFTLSAAACSAAASSIARTHFRSCRSRLAHGELLFDEAVVDVEHAFPIYRDIVPRID